MRTKLVSAMFAMAVGLTVVACGSPDAGGQGSGGTSSVDAQQAAKELGIDLSKCPVDMTKPITGTVKVGTTLAQTGPVAPALAPIAIGMKAGVATFNATPGVPVQISQTIRDDQFSPDKALAAAQQLVQSDQVDILAGSVGTAQVAAVRPVAEKYCVPFIGANGGGSSIIQPAAFPMTVQWGQPFYLDVQAWFGYLAEKFPNGAKVAVLTGNTESGKDYLAAIDEISQGTKFEIVSKTTIDSTETAPPSSQVTAMKASGAEVLLAQPAPSGQCASTITEVAKQGWKPEAFMLTSSCSTLQLMQPAGAAADGVLCNLYLNDPAAGTAASDPGLQKIVAAIESVSPGTPPNGSMVSGYSHIEFIGKAIEQAAKSPLGVSRLGILYAATHIKYQTSAFQPGNVELNWPTDEVAMESVVLNSFDGSTGQWEKIKEFNYEGQLTGKAGSR